MAESTALPTVSVVVVNYRGAADTIACLRALRDELDYPANKLQMIVVDNASGDDSISQIKTAIPEATLVTSIHNTGFAGGCNLGARTAKGEVLAFINNDAKPHPQWVRAAVETLRADSTIGAVASKVLSWDGTNIDFVDGGLTWFGMGYKRHVGEPDSDRYNTAKDVLFGTGSALFVRTKLFAELGGFDERFFMFYEDVDLGWRLNLRGWRVRYEPKSVAYHRHHGSMTDVHPAREYFLLERNALAMLYKNLSDENLAQVLPAALALAVRRATARGNIDPTQLEITRRPNDKAVDDEPIPIAKEALAGFLAIDQFVELLPELSNARQQEQAERVRGDIDIYPLLREAMEPAYPLPRYLAAHEVLVKAFNLQEIFQQRRRVAVITGDVITEQMAGPAIRAWNIAATLAEEHDVRLVSVNRVSAYHEANFSVFASRQRELGKHVDWADIIVTQGHILEFIPSLQEKSSAKILVCDVYDPMHLELLEQSKDNDEERRGKDIAGVTKVINNQLLRGDFFLCASTRQRHFWLGHLAAIGRLTPELYDADPTAESLLAVAPFGLPSSPPKHNKRSMRGKITGINQDDKIALWAGGVYSWFDPLTLVRAMDQLRHRRDNARLVFLGMQHPNPDVPEMGIADQTRQLADELGLTGQTVFFNETWVPYAQRHNFLLEANCGVTTHFEHVETTFAFRTRVLDYLWSGLPIVTTNGDSFAELVETEKLGIVVPAEDVSSLADALERVLYDTDFAAACSARIAAIRERFTWDKALAPLVKFCRDPRVAADRLPGRSPLTTSARLTSTQRVRRDLRLFRQYLSAGGPAEVARRVSGRVIRLSKGRLQGGRHER